MDVTYDVTATLRAQDHGHSPLVLIYDARGNGWGTVCPTITGDHQNRVTDYTALVVEVNEQDGQEMLSEHGLRLVERGRDCGNASDSGGGDSVKANLVLEERNERTNCNGIRTGERRNHAGGVSNIERKP